MEDNTYTEPDWMKQYSKWFKIAQVIGFLGFLINAPASLLLGQGDNFGFIFMWQSVIASVGWILLICLVVEKMRKQLLAIQNNLPTSDVNSSTIESQLSNSFRMWRIVLISLVVASILFTLWMLTGYSASFVTSEY